MRELPRVAIVIYDRCQPKKCGHECYNFCPGVRMGEETIVIDEKSQKPIISEELCTGCGICSKKCPFDAIVIVNLPEELEENLVHRFGPSGFRLYGLPIPRERSVVGILGQNGIGKTTSIRILAGELRPNLGRSEPPSEEEILEFFKGSELQGYFQKLFDGEIRVAYKPQYIEPVTRIVRGDVRSVLRKADERGVLDELRESLELSEIMDRDLRELSGGELQRVVIAAAISKEADVYIFDEPSSYLDVRQRLNVAREIRRLAEKGKSVLVVEHDLVVMDYLTDYVHICYGRPMAYGIVSGIKGSRVGINTYLEGYLREENVRFRKESIRFEPRPPPPGWESQEIMIRFSDLRKRLDGFELSVEAGEVYAGEVIGIMGPNGIGKTTFAKLLAGVLKPDQGEISRNVVISYKPQYISPDFEGTVEELLFKIVKHDLYSSYYKTEILRPLQIEDLMDRKVPELSGGELQRVAIAVALSRDANVYLLDEPSAYLDVEQRLAVARLIRRVIEKRGAAGMVIDHDLLLLDYVSDRAMVFLGEPGVRGHAYKPSDLRTAMNKFLSSIGVTFRRDPATGRPRANKPGSKLDREQKALGEYYYLVTDLAKIEAEEDLEEG